MAALFPMAWPEEVEAFFELQSAISSASQALLSPDCELSHLNSADAFFSKQIGFACLPIAIVCVCEGVWKCLQLVNYRRRRRRGGALTIKGDVSRQDFRDRAILSWVVLLYLAYPTAVKQALAMLSCERVGGVFWLSHDLEEPCLKGRHLYYTLALCLPQVFLYVLGLPLGATLVLFRKRKILHTQRVMFRWGLLYAGYRHYAWELSIVVRKVSLVLVGGVFGAKLGPDMQVYLALALVIVFIICHLVAQPFDVITQKHTILHWLELCSLAVCWSTLYCGMLFWIGPPRISHNFLVFLSFYIIGVNVSFTAVVLFQYCRGLRLERRKEGEHTLEALREQTLQRMRKRLEGVGASDGTRFRRGAPQARLRLRQKTFRGSLKYNLKVAIHLETAKTNSTTYYNTRGLRRIEMIASQNKARNRLAQRRSKRALAAKRSRSVVAPRRETTMGEIKKGEGGGVEGREVGRDRSLAS
jgi:hypothetical protein